MRDTSGDGGCVAQKVSQRRADGAEFDFGARNRLTFDVYLWLEAQSPGVPPTNFGNTIRLPGCSESLKSVVGAACEIVSVSAVTVVLARAVTDSVTAISGTAAPAVTK